MFIVLFYKNNREKYINNWKHLTITNKCSKLYVVIKGCEIMEENKLVTQNELAIEDIKNLIYTIRGKQVMIDSDVANIYHCETKYVNRVVKRNIERFPEEFCFQLNED